MRDTFTESHSCAKDTQEWGTTAPTLTIAKTITTATAKGGGQECPPYTSILCYSIPNSFTSAFHLPSTCARVLESITISSGHGRVKPSVDHLRVASIPIFDP
jgi:hypothetical protein